MASLLTQSLLCIAFFVSHGLCASSPDLPCGDWIPFKNEKCIFLASNAGFQTKEDAEIVCKSFTGELHVEDVPKLVTIKSEEKQTFLHKYLFVELDTLDNVWLGLDLGKDGVFRWNDGTELLYTNWAVDAEPMADHERNCVQMESGEGTIEAGKWAKANCKKRNAIVCERDQPWTVSALQNAVLSLKLELGLHKDKISRLENNPVPVGFIYVQLANQQPPTTLWPQTTWTDVTSTYEGLFFRAAGGTAAAFGDIQEESTSRLEEVEYHESTGTLTCSQGKLTLPADGAWTPFLWAGGNDGSWRLCWRFRLTGTETRPRNQAVQVWQRNA